jgi:hypothetical protein
LCSYSIPSFVFQNHCIKEFRLYDAIQRLPEDKIIVLSPKPDHNPPLTPGSIVYLWEADKPYRGLVARGVVEDRLEDMDMPQWQHQFCVQPQKKALRSVIRIEHIYNRPVSRSDVRSHPGVINAKFFGAEKNPQGTIFKIDPSLETILDVGWR